MGILVVKQRIQATCDCCGFQLITCELWASMIVLDVPCSNVNAFGIWILDFWNTIGIMVGFF